MSFKSSINILVYGHAMNFQKEKWGLSLSFLSLFRIGIFGAANGWGGK